jgi:sugar lactone lactonase YvrE
MTFEPQVVVPCANILGEGAFWDAAGQRLWWLDVPMPSRLFSLDPRTGRTSTDAMPEMITCMRALKDGSGLIVASHGGINRFEFADRHLVRLLDPEPHLPFNRCNDGATDALGRLWFGTMQNNVAPNGDGIDIVEAAGGLYRLDPDLSLAKVEGGITISNTVCWSPDNRTFYFCDTAKGVISAYDFDLAAGAISRKRDFARFDRGAPDGSTVDAEGYLWNARWGGGCVVRFDPDGAVDRVVDLPVSLVTSVAFGGPDLSDLYVTTARYGKDEAALAAEPLAGHLFSFKPGVTGIAATPFG